MTRALNYSWRLFATGTCFLVFGIGGMLTTIIALPLIALCSHSAEHKQQLSRRAVRYLFRFFVGLIALLRLADFVIPERERLSSLQGKLILANHPCLIDVVVLLSIVPNADCVIKAHLLKNPFIRWVIESCGYIANDDPIDMLDSCQETLAKGNNLIIFPEGTRTTPGESVKLQRGAANIAVRCQASVIVLTIQVTPSTLTKNDNWYQIPEKKFTFSVKIKDNAPVPETGQSISKETRRYTRVLENYFSKEVQHS